MASIELTNMATKNDPKIADKGLYCVSLIFTNAIKYSTFIQNPKDSI